jgi:preprotein translocase subunit SecF
MKYKKIWLGLSVLILLPGLVSLFLWGLRLGIDFKGGSLSEYQSGGEGSAIQSIIESTYKDLGLGEIKVQSDLQSNQDNRFFVRSQSISEDTHKEIVRRFESNNPPIKELSFETTEAQVGEEVTRRALLAVALASAAIIAYIALSFRGVPKPTSSWQFGVFAVIALLHDVLFILGFYSLMGHFAGWEVNADFVTATLTVMGFSVHDTIVVFDRSRENLKRFPGRSFTEIADMSVTQTMTRSLNTSLTVVLVLLAVVLLGGATIRPFSLTLLVGIVVGTYSSIFVATALLDWWHSATMQRMLKHFRARFTRKPSNRSTQKTKTA